MGKLIVSMFNSQERWTASQAVRHEAKTFGGETTTRAVPAKPWVVDDYLGDYTTKVYNIIDIVIILIVLRQ